MISKSIDRYLQYIKEDNEFYWDLDKDEIESFFKDLEIDGYEIRISKELFVSKPSNMKPSSENVLQITDYDIDEMPEHGDEFTVGYYLIIESDKKETDAPNVSDVFMDGYQRMLSSGYDFLIGYAYEASRYNSDIEFYKEDIEEIRFKNGNMWVQMDDRTPKCNRCDFVFYQTSMMKCDFKTMKGVLGIKGEKTVTVRIDEMAAAVLNRRSNEQWSELLLSPEKFTDNYWSEYYYQDVDGIIKYDLTDENLELLIRKAIDTIGYEEFIEWCDNEHLEKLNQEEVISYLMKERFKTTLINYPWKDHEFFEDIERILSDFYMYAHSNESYEKLLKEFDNIVYDNIETKVKRRWGETKMYNTYLKKNITDNCYLYDIDIDISWLKMFDYVDSLWELTTDDIFAQWSGENDIYESLDPMFPDYGTPDKKEMNDEVKHILT